VQPVHEQGFSNQLIVVQHFIHFPGENLVDLLEDWLSDMQWYASMIQEMFAPVPGLYFARVVNIRHALCWSVIKKIISLYCVYGHYMSISRGKRHNLVLNCVSKSYVIWAGARLKCNKN
jgi:hypothetical protein